MDDTRPDTIYKWTIRTLYGVAVAVNVWYLMETYRDTPEGKRLLTKAETYFRRVVKPWHERKRFRRMADEAIVEAWLVVDDAAKGQGE